MGFKEIYTQRQLARKSDPASSHIAAQRMVDTDAIGEQQRLVLDLVKRYPNHTSDELAGLGRLDRYQLARRLPELERDGFIERGRLRKSTKSGRPAVTWHVRGVL